MSSFLQTVRRLAEEVTAREGCYLYDVDFIGAGRTLRVTIDKEGEQGASIDDCANVSRGINLLLDVEDIIPGGAYQLEVSSPGLERVLKEPRHFQTAIGQRISVKTFAPLLEFNAEIPALGKAKQLQGELSAIEESGIRLTWADRASVHQVFVPFATVTKAHVVFEFPDAKAMKPGHGKGKKTAKNSSEEKKGEGEHGRR